MATSSNSGCSDFISSNGAHVSASFAGHAVRHTPQPRQSYGESCMRKLYFGASLPRPFAGAVTKESGTPAFSSSVSRTGRIAACGQHIEQRLHWMQASGFHFGTLVATPRLE